MYNVRWELCERNFALLAPSDTKVNEQKVEQKRQPHLGMKRIENVLVVENAIDMIYPDVGVRMCSYRVLSALRRVYGMGFIEVSPSETLPVPFTNLVHLA